MNPFNQINNLEDSQKNINHKKIYFSIAILIAILFSLFYIIRYFSEKDFTEKKIQLIEKVNDGTEVNVDNKVENLQKVNTESFSREGIEQIKDDLIRKVQ